MATINGHSSKLSRPIAIVGMACRFPGGASNPSKLWDLCAAGKDGWSPIPSDRFDVKSLYDANSEAIGRSHVVGGHFLKEDVAQFDAGFFNLPTDIATAMDPQIRLLLESVYEATEDAGVPLETLMGSNTSVFAGCFARDYQGIQTKDPELISAPFLSSNWTTMIANRISHFYDLRGASLTIDTACSSALVALHQGCQTIHSGESNMSIIGASSLMLNQDLFISMTALGMLATDGRCYAWDTRAQGYGRGEGVAALILKSLDAAIKDGDHIHAVVRESGINQDGKTTTITTPSLTAQVDLIRDCYERAGLDLSETAYVEAHMTGTKAGDTIEAEAIADTFGKSRRDGKVIVGSVKTNIGHTEPVSGLAAIIKTAFAFKHGLIPPNLNYKETNPEIDLDGWHLQVPTHLTKWPQGMPFRASINNFGYGGTNAHVILEGWPPARPHMNGTGGANGVKGLNGHNYHKNGSKVSESQRIYVISAKDARSCKESMRNLAVYLRQSLEHGRGLSARDLAYTLSERRSRLPWAVAVRASSLEELAERLEKPTFVPSQAARRPRLGFVFNGQGAQWYAMGRELISTYPVFAASIHKAANTFYDYGATWSLYDELMRDEKSTRVAEINLSQPISVALQLCLVDLLKSWGVTPSAVTSHSSGEIAAAYAVDALSFEEALGAVYFRGELALKYQKKSSLAGGMLAAGVGLDKAEQYLKATTAGGCVVVACINSPDSVTLSGDLPDLDEVASRLENDGLFARRLKVPLAYHSHHMLPMAQEYVDRLRSVISRSPNCDSSVVFASPVTGGVITLDTLTPEHWALNLLRPVRFSEAFESMYSSDANVDTVVEVGAHSTLAGPIRQILNGRKVGYVSCLKRSTNAIDTMQDLACELLARGYPVNLKSVNAPLGGEVHFTPDLPTYPWNHGTRYWMEPRTSRETRFKKYPPHELLGVPISGTTGLTPIWRNFLRISDLPWLVDHQVDSSVIFPGAGYIIMAIEAVRLVTDTSSPSSGYRLRDVNFIKALAIPESSTGVETHTRLHPCSETELDHRGWYEFEVGSVDAGGSWIKNCHGFVSVEPYVINKSPLYREADIPREDAFLEPGAKIREMNSASLYTMLRGMKLEYGPEFRNVQNVRVVGNKTISNISIPEVASGKSNYIIHPTTLDAIIQTSLLGLPKESTHGYMFLPKKIGSIFVPDSGLSGEAGSRLKAFMEIRHSDIRGLLSNIAVSSADSLISSSSSFLRMDDFHYQGVVIDLDDATDQPEFPIRSQTRWEIDIQHRIPASVKESMKIPLSDHEADFENKLLRSAYHFIYDTVTELQNEDRNKWAPHHKILYDWMVHIVSLGTSGSLSPGSKAWSKTSKGMKKMLNDELSAEYTSGKLVVRVGRQLASIIRGEIPPLEMMMEGNLLNQYYMEQPRLRDRTYRHLSQVVELFAVKNPGAKVLEIGAGTGGATKTVLEAFGSRGDGSGSLLDRYTFTDISAGFFEAAKQKLAAWEGILDFAKLDIESDPAEQAFVPGSYDLIVASMVLHATKSLYKTMSHVRKLLKPGGKLLLIETTQEQLGVQLIFGTLPGWWLGEEPYRRYSPNAPLTIWNEVLREAGFSGIDFDIGDFDESRFQSFSVIMTTAAATPSYPSLISVLYTDQDSKSWAAQLSGAIREHTGIVPSVESLSQVKSVQDKVCIFTAEMNGPFLDGIGRDSFENLQSILTNCRGVFWLSCGGIIDSHNPAYGPLQGLLRTLRQEYLANRYVALDFESYGDRWSEDKIPFVLHVLRESFDYSRELGNIEWEYAVKDSTLHVSRIYAEKDNVFNGVGLEPQRQPFHQPGHPLVWTTSSKGTLRNVCFTEADEISGDVPAGMVEIEAKAFGLNFRDVMTALGQLDDTLTGHDCAGIVTRLGPGTEQSGLRVGDRVCALSKGRFASTSWAYWTGVAKIPDFISWEDGAAIPVAYATAYHSLVHVGRLRKGESVLIHAAAGGTGQAAVVVAQHVGAKVFVTCSSEEKRDLLYENYGIDYADIFSSRDISFAAAIRKATGGKGVDVVLNSLSGSMLNATWSSVARFGRFVEIGKVDIEAARSLNTAPFGRCASYSGVDLLQLNEYSGALTHSALTEGVQICQERMKARDSHPMHPIERYSISNMENAMRQIQSGLNVGKLVLVPREGDQVNVIPRPIPLSFANPDATYLIAGGLGGIGREISLWMAENGAKNIVLVSRNAESHPEAAQLVSAAKKEGCRIHIRNCDVSDEESLLSLLAYCSFMSLPPFKGVINGAMVLADSIFERMTFEQWQLAIQTKVRSSINLHNHLPSLSFFVMLSSVAGVMGNVSQANYAAGNTFEDILARHRAASGQPATSIDLSAVTDAGYVAAHSSGNSVQARVESLGSISCDMDTILRIIGDAVTQRVSPARPDGAQIIVGLMPWERMPESAFIRMDPRFGTLRLASPRGSATSASAAETEAAATSPTRMLMRGLEAAEGTAVVSALAERLAGIFSISAEHLDPGTSMASHGVDSLVAVELRNWLATVAKAKVSTFEILQSASISDFAGLILERSQLGKKD
ncbi:hypothetical protein GGS23DRAFT_556890 [Durotheca rogersii]|uniref:uncharacterized protein n=1 Tax=Durotheca rogersii TaxID=419775 RepID=UPI002221129A|nr:uncharacterized protein GGS23DRAFT_556890 [Durotheca rogersii]KAI5866390.1 hypothetical protein GGS23DRAFT_556890 [Durotheca rogersii]